MATTTLLTAEEFLALPNEEERLLDLDEGEVVEMTRPGMPHGIVVGRLGFELETAMRAGKLGVAIPNEIAFILNDGTVRSPDIAILFGDRAVVKPGPVYGPPDIAIEVVSPHDWSAQINRKRKQYLDAGAQEVWIVEPEIQMVEIYRQDGSWSGIEAPSVLTSRLIPGLAIDLAAIFLLA